MPVTASQFAAESLKLTPYRPAKTRHAEGHCWLCGGPLDAHAWPLREAVPDTMVAPNRAKCPESSAVCWQCAAMSAKTTWDSYVAAHPEKGLKTGYASSWRNYSHVFADGLHDCPTRERWRDWLLNPPAPPFLFILAISSQKHLIFRGRVSHDRNLFSVQFEEEQFTVDRTLFAACLADFEALYVLGFSKDSILKNDYHPKQLMKVGLSVWKPLADKADRWRAENPSLMRLAHFCAQKPEEAE